MNLSIATSGNPRVKFQPCSVHDVRLWDERERTKDLCDCKPEITDHLRGRDAPYRSIQHHRNCAYSRQIAYYFELERG